MPALSYVSRCTEQEKDLVERFVCVFTLVSGRPLVADVDYGHKIIWVYEVVDFDRKAMMEQWLKDAGLPYSIKFKLIQTAL